MKSLYEFMTENQQPAISISSDVKAEITNAITASSIGDAALSLANPKVKPDEAIKFSNKINELVESESFLKDLSSDIGKPMPDETEDQFVERCKESMKNLLKRHLE